MHHLHECVSLMTGSMDKLQGRVTSMRSPTCQGAGAAVSPARPAVLWDVLVAGGAHVIDSIDVSPVPALGQLGEVQILMRPFVRSVGRNRGAQVCPASV